MKNAIKVGDLVRVSKVRKAPQGGTTYSYRFGQVVKVTSLYGWNDTPGYVMCADSKGHPQALGLHQVKPAKQAMRKREAYANRRG